MNKLIGYLIALAGLIAMALSFIKIPALSAINSKTILIAGIILVLVGVVLTLGRKENPAESEVPIYEGKRKKRKVVGYQRMKK